LISLIAKMKKPLIITIFIIISLAGFSQKNLYLSPNIVGISKNHKTIGIIPFNISTLLSPEERQKLAKKQLKKMNIIEDGKIQSSVYTWFLKKKEEGHLSVNIQDILTTNTLLQKAGITSKNQSRYSPSDLAKILGVDAIIQIGVLEGMKNNMINFYIYNSEDGELLLKFNKDISVSIDTSTNDFMDDFMKKPAKSIVYTN